MRFRTIDSNDAYIVINSDVFTERTTSFKLCAFDITQANKIKIVEIENLLEELPQAFTIKESSVTSILKKIDKNCNKDAANLPK